MDRPGAADYDVSKRGGGLDADRDGGVAVAPPPTQTGRDGGGTDNDTARGRTGGGNHRLLLLDSPRHTEALVVRSLTQTLPVDADHARNVFATSKALGMAIIISCLKEHAEAYMLALYRSGVQAAIEPDTSVE